MGFGEMLQTLPEEQQPVHLVTLTPRVVFQRAQSHEALPVARLAKRQAKPSSMEFGAA